MGYYTVYRLDHLEGCDEDALRGAIHEATGCSRCPFSDDGEPTKWYDHERDICAAMKASGATLVIVHGEGDEQGDIWDKRFELVDDVSKRIEVKTRRYKLEAEAW